MTTTQTQATVSNDAIAHLAKVGRTVNAIIELAREENISVEAVCESLLGMAQRKLKNSIVNNRTGRR